MRKYSFLLPVISIWAGVGGFLLRRRELDTVYDSAGLAAKNTPVSVALMLLAVAVIALSALCGIILSRRETVSGELSRIFLPLSPLGSAVNIIVGVFLIGGAVQYVREVTLPYAANLSSLSFIVFSAMSGISFIFLAFPSLAKKNRGWASFFSIIPSLFLCLWLIFAYRDNNTNPVLIDFYIYCLALAFSALSFYYCSGYSFGRAKLGMTAFTHLPAIFLCITAVADGLGFARRLMLIGVAAMLFVNFFRFIYSLKRRKA